MLKTTSKLQNAVSILNRIDPNKLSIIVTRVLVSNTNNLSALFDAKEIQKLLKVFDISEPDLVSLVQSLHFLFMQAAFERNFRPVEGSLKANGISAEHLSCLQAIWSENGGEYINKIKDKPIAIEKQLSNVSWNLAVPYKESTLPIIQKVDLLPDAQKPNLASENLYSDDARNPTAIINFEVKRSKQQQQLTNEEPKATSSDVFSVQMNKKEAQKFFEQLELIQSHLDDLI